MPRLFGRKAPTASNRSSKSPAGIFWGADGRQWAIKSGGPVLNDDQGGWIPRDAGSGLTRELHNAPHGYAQAYQASVWAFRCVNIRANKIAELLNQAQLVDRRTGQAVDTNPFREALDRSYARYDQDFFEAVVFNRDLFGEIYTQLITASPPGLDWFRTPYTVRALPSLAVEPFIDRGRITKFIYSGDDFQVVELFPDEVAYDHTYRPDDPLRGLSLMAQVMTEVNVDLHIITFDKNFFKNSARPGLLFAPKDGTFTPGDYEYLKTWLKEKVAGLANAFKPIPFSRPMDVTKVEPPTLEDQTYLSDDMLSRICAGFGVPVGLVKHSEAKYQLSPEQNKSFYEHVIIPDTRHLARYINVRVLPFFDSDAHWAFNVEPALLEVMALIEDQEKKERIARSRYESGGITFNEFRQALGLQPESAGGDFYLFPSARIVVPRADLLRVAELLSHASALPSLEIRTGAAAQPRELLPPAPHSVLPAGKASFGTPDGTVVLYLAEVEGLLELQQVLMRALPSDARIRWTPVEQLHITLVHAPLVDEHDFRQLHEETAGAFIGLEIGLLEVATFPASGDLLPIVVLVDPSGPLRALQSEIAGLFSARGIALSEYSQPNEWRPHITVGYAQASDADVVEQHVRLSADNMTVQAISLAFTRGDYRITDVHTVPTKAFSHLDAADELRAWRKVALKHGPDRALKFVCHHIPQDIQQDIRESLDFTGDRDGLTALFEQAHRRMTSIPGQAIAIPSSYLAGKAIQATRLDFEGEFGDVLAAATRADIDRREWALRTRTLLRKYGEKAYRDGLNDGGVGMGDEESLDDGDRADLNRLLADQSQYVTELGRVLFKTERGVAAGQEAIKPEMWWNKSVMPLYQAGRLSADRNGNQLWILNLLKQNCETCLAASTQVHRLRDWHKSGILPQADPLYCRGFLCGCKLQKTTDRARGRLDQIPRRTEAVKAVPGADGNLDTSLPAEIAHELGRVLGRHIENGRIDETADEGGQLLYSLVLRDTPGYYATLDDAQAQQGLTMIDTRLILHERALLDEERMSLSFTLKDGEHG